MAERFSLLGRTRQGRRARPWAVLLLTLAWLAAPEPVPAQETSPGELQGLNQEPGFYLAPKVKRYLHSHTTYQFGYPGVPGINPLSRLEFPLNSWWGGLEMAWRHPGYSLNLELMTNLSRETDGGKFKDSDWLTPGKLTIYDEQNCRLERSFTLDFNADVSMKDFLGLPKGLDLRPTIGARWQRFTLVAHDGYQTGLGANGLWYSQYNFEGDSIWFRQDYVQGYLGVKLMAELPMGWTGKTDAPNWQIFLQGDWGPVAGQNKDRHLLRGDRVTEESTKGDAWHLAGGLKVPLGGRLGALSLGCDYLRIRTRGDHLLYGDEGDGYGYYEESWSDGVKVWSDQISFTFSWEISF